MSNDASREIVRVGVDLAKAVLQVHAVDQAGRAVVAKSIPRSKFIDWCSQLPAGCLVVMETGSGAHHWARELAKLGLEPRLIAAHLVRPYRMQGSRAKNDANDAAAICEAASRPTMRFVSPKSPEQQAILGVHRLREGYKEERVACTNRIRALLTEFGLVFPKSPAALQQQLPAALAAATDLPPLTRMAIQRARLALAEIACHIAWCDERIQAHARHDGQARASATLPGIGPVTASAMVATVGDFSQFANGRQLSSWLGLVPRQNSSGGRPSLGRITRRGDDYLRTLLVQGAKSAVRAAADRTDRISRWISQLVDRVGWQKAVVALANKNARILWSVLVRGKDFDPDHAAHADPRGRPGPATYPMLAPMSM